MASRHKTEKSVQQALTNHIREKWNIQQLIQRILLKYHLILVHLNLSKDILLRLLYSPLLIHLTLLHLIFQTKSPLQTKSFKVSLPKNLITLFLKLKLINFIVISSIPQVSWSNSYNISNTKISILSKKNPTIR